MMGNPRDYQLDGMPHLLSGAFILMWGMGFALWGTSLYGVNWIEFPTALAFIAAGTGLAVHGILMLAHANRSEIDRYRGEESCHICGLSLTGAGLTTALVGALAISIMGLYLAAYYSAPARGLPVPPVPAIELDQFGLVFVSIAIAGLAVAGLGGALLAVDRTLHRRSQLESQQDMLSSVG